MNIDRKSMMNKNEYWIITFDLCLFNPQIRTSQLLFSMSIVDRKH